MANLPELQSLTFENNIMLGDEDSLCALFSNLRGYERLENLNVRQNKFTFSIVNALAQGIQDKRELRVSQLIWSMIHSYFKLLSKLSVSKILMIDCGSRRKRDWR